MCTTIARGLAAIIAFAGAFDSAGQEVTLPADSGLITAPFVCAQGSVHQPVRTDLARGGRAAYTFTITNGGEYAVALFVKAPAGRSNSFYVNLDAEPVDPAMIWDVPTSETFTNSFVTWRGNGTPDRPQFSAKFFALAPGPHRIIVRGRAAQTEFTRLSLWRRPTPAGNLRAVIPGP